MTDLFISILNTGISAGWLILAVLVLRVVLKRAPKWTRVLLWGLVGVRLLCPFSFESAWSLLPSRQTIPPQIMMAQTPAIQSGVPFINGVVNPILNQSLAPTVGDSVNPLQVALPVLAMVWAAGAAVLAGYAVVSFWMLRRRVRTAVKLQDNIYQSERIDSPFLLGILRPRIYLPFDLQPDTLLYVTAHEQAHIRRRDHWWKLLGFVLLCVYWVHPLVWAAYLLLCRDIELACDEKVIRTLEPDKRADYSQALLNCSAHRRRLRACPLAFGEVGVKQRVQSVLHYRKPAFWVIVLALAVCAATALFFLTDPAASDDGSSSAQTSSRSSGAAVLSQESAQEFIAQTLSGFTLQPDNTVSFSLPDAIPQAEDGKTHLAITLNVSYATEPGTYLNESLLDMADGWHGGDRYTTPLDTTKGELVSITFAVFFITDVTEDSFEIYASDSVELTEPFDSNTSTVARTPSVELLEESGTASVLYRLEDGSAMQLSFTLPADASLGVAVADITPSPLIVSRSSSKNCGSVQIYGFGAPDLATLETVDTAENSLPMQIFATVALSNHAGYEEYEVQRHWDTGAAAVARYWWQDLDTELPAAEVPSQYMDCVLAYDWNASRFFVEMRFEEGVFTREELAAIADSIQLVSMKA